MYCRVRFGSYAEEVDVGVLGEEVGPATFEIFFTPIDNVMRFRINGVEVADFDLTNDLETVLYNFVQYRAYSDVVDENLLLEANNVFFSIRDVS